MQNLGTETTMGKTKYTPGPWKFNGNDSPLRGTVTATSAPDERGRTQEIVANLPGNNGVVQESVAANARLIAAAPSLLSALKGLLASHDASCPGESCPLTGIDVARWVVQQAEGGAK